MKETQGLRFWLWLGLIGLFLYACSPPSQGVSIPTFTSPAMPVATLITPAVYISTSESPVPPEKPNTATPTTTATATITPPPPCVATQGSILTDEIPAAADASSAYERPIAVRVYLPPCYGIEEGRLYPLLVMLHGQSFREDQWERIGIARAADELIASGQIAPLVIVMPREEFTLADPVDYHYDQRLTDEVIPWAEAHFSTCRTRACRAIGGLSRGGAWAMRTGLSRPDLFGAVGAHSAPPHFNDPYRLRDWFSHMPDDAPSRFYLDAGRTDPYLSFIKDYEERLQRQRIPHEWYLFNGTHNEEYWSAHVADYLRWYSQPWLPAGE